jgi:hypothetical protein
VTTTLQAIENWVGQPLSKNTIQTVMPNLLSNTTEIPANLTCTDCTKAAYALIRPHLNDANRGTWDNAVTGQCGSSYTGGSPLSICLEIFTNKLLVDGSTPSGIVQSANSATQSTTNGAISSIASWSTTALLAGVASLAVLAL